MLVGYAWGGVARTTAWKSAVQTRRRIRSTTEPGEPRAHVSGVPRLRGQSPPLGQPARGAARASSASAASISPNGRGVLGAHEARLGERLPGPRAGISQTFRGARLRGTGASDPTFLPEPRKARNTGAMRRCFGCGVNTPASELTKVGDGEFCARCFDHLLSAARPAARGEEQSPSPEPTGGGPARASEGSSPSRGPGEPAAGSRSAAADRCVVCRAVLGRERTVFLGGDICLPCTDQMRAELQRVESPAASSSTAAPVAQPGGLRAAAALARSPASREAPPLEAASPGAEPFTPGAGTAYCAGCDRPMPGPGSYRRLGGQPYCAACLPFFSARQAGGQAVAQQAGGQAVAQQAAAATARPPAPPERCECCSRSLEPTAARCEGFWLCSACTGSDRPLALGIARARHVRRMRRLEQELGEGSS